MRVIRYTVQSTATALQRPATRLEEARELGRDELVHPTGHVCTRSAPYRALRRTQAVAPDVRVDRIGTVGRVEVGGNGDGRQIRVAGAHVVAVLEAVAVRSIERGGEQRLDVEDTDIGDPAQSPIPVRLELSTGLSRRGGDTGRAMDRRRGEEDEGIEASGSQRRDELALEPDDRGVQDVDS